MSFRIARPLAAIVALMIIKAVAPSPSIVPAEIVGFTGSAHLYTDPASVVRDMWESNGRTRVFEEQAGFTLDEGVLVNITAPGLVDSRSDFTPGMIEAGTAIDSYLIHQDPVGPRGPIYLTGKIRFDREILGVIVDKTALANSDALLGNPNTDYPEVSFARGLEFRQPLEMIKISADRHTLKYELYTTTVMDQIRVITAAAPVPAPGCAALLLGGLLGPSRRRRMA